jgi:hypothetical protein
MTESFTHMSPRQIDPRRRPQRRAVRGCRGSAVIEFVLCAALLIVPMLLGTAVIGLNLIREIQITELCRDATHMYSQHADFTQTSYQNELLKIAQGLDITATGGNGVIVLSTITFMDQPTCESVYGSNWQSDCTNYNYTVFTRQVVIGNSTLYSSAFGTPPVDTSNSDNVTQANQMTNSSARASNPGGGNFSLVPVAAYTQYAYVGEVYFTTPDLSWWGPLGTTHITARFIF